VAILASDAVDLEADRRRRDRQRAELEAEVRRAEGKLSNDAFVAKAPDAVVAAERAKLERLRRELEELGAP
jgi:valyl-tRNA synthetase